MRKLTQAELILISNALFGKANGDRAEASGNAILAHPTLAATLLKQADVAEELANLFLMAETAEVEES